MAAYKVMDGQRAIHEKTLKPGVVDSVQFMQDTSTVDVINLDGNGRIYFTVDGTEPAVAGPTTYVLVAAFAFERVQTPVTNTVVKLISDGAPTYSVVAR